MEQIFELNGYKIKIQVLDKNGIWLPFFGKELDKEEFLSIYRVPLILKIQD